MWKVPLEVLWSDWGIFALMTDSNMILCFLHLQLEFSSKTGGSLYVFCRDFLKKKKAKSIFIKSLS